MRRYLKTLPSQQRRGVALLLALMALVIIGALVGTTSWQIMSNRRLAQIRHNELQAVWIARGGIELACARILNEPTGYTGESLALLPQGRLRIEVTRKKDAPDQWQIVSEGRYPVEHSNEMRRSLMCQIRRVSKDGKISIQMERPVTPTEE